MLLKITLKCSSLRVVLDLLNQVVSVDAMWSFHCWIRHSWTVEVNVLLVDCTVELVVRVRWRNVTIFFRSKLFFHFVCAWAAWLNRLSCSIVSLLTRVFSDSSSGFPDLSEEPSSSCKPWSSISWERDVSPLTTSIGLGFGEVGLENVMLNFSKKLLNEFIDWLLFNCRTQFIIPSSPIVIVS